MSAKPTIPAATPAPVAAPEPTQLEAFLDQHFRKLLIGLGVLVLIMAVWALMSHRAHEANVAAAIAATQAKTPEDCDIVIAANPGTTAAGNAMLKKAKLAWDANKKDSSVAVLKDFVAKFKGHPLIVEGLTSLATRLENMGTYDEAQKIYEQILADYPSNAIAGLAQLRLGDILWHQGKEAEAKKMYEEMPRKFPGSAFFEDHQTRLEWLGAGLPTKEVEGPKAPPASIAAPPAPGAKATPTATLTPSGSAATIPVKPGEASQPIKLNLGGAQGQTTKVVVPPPTPAPAPAAAAPAPQPAPASNPSTSPTPPPAK